MIPTRVFAVCMILCPVGSAFAQMLTPPPVPAIPPVISESYAGDKDGNGIDDKLDLVGIVEPEPGEEPVIDGLVDVELIFRQQITQEQIDDFLRVGGTIDYIYQAVSYGWQGTVPVAAVESLPELMGDTLVLVKGPKFMKLDMDVATQTGRVRPIWKPGIAGRTYGYDGDPSIVIGIIDSGVDGLHPDLAGRCARWVDESDDNNSTSGVEIEEGPVDYDGHGTHVAGIAVGTGECGGQQGGILRYTFTGNLKDKPPIEFQPFLISLPAVSLRAEARAAWTGGATGTLKLLKSLRGTATYSSWKDSSGQSGLSLSDIFTPSSAYSYCFGLFNTGGLVQDYAITAFVTDYPAVDEFNKFRGIAPECRWAAAKVFGRDGTSHVSTRCKDFSICRALDGFVVDREAYEIKVINISLGLGTAYEAENTLLVNQVNTAVNNGIVVVLSAGNEGNEGQDADRAIRDFKYAAKAITVGASNDENALAAYSSLGLKAPASGNEDHKPDLIAPGGSKYYTGILSVDSGTSDGYALPDGELNDYAVKKGTSMSAPFVAGCAALIIDAMQQEGTVWTFAGDQQPMFVKMLLCATATETGKSREDGLFSEELQPQRAAPGLYGFPEGKDRYEGYGIINPDAAVEAVARRYHDFTSGPYRQSATLGALPTDRRAWARSLAIDDWCDSPITVTLKNPATGDFDLYLYECFPGETGEPKIIGASTNMGNAMNERIVCFDDYDCGLVPGYSRVSFVLVVKRVSGFGTFTVEVSNASVVEGD